MAMVTQSERVIISFPSFLVLSASPMQVGNVSPILLSSLFIFVLVISTVVPDAAAGHISMSTHNLFINKYYNYTVNTDFTFLASDNSDNINDDVHRQITTDLSKLSVSNKDNTTNYALQNTLFLIPKSTQTSNLKMTSSSHQSLRLSAYPPGDSGMFAQTYPRNLNLTTYSNPSDISSNHTNVSGNVVSHQSSFDNFQKFESLDDAPEGNNDGINNMHVYYPKVKRPKLYDSNTRIIRDVWKQMAAKRNTDYLKAKNTNVLSNNSSNHISDSVSKTKGLRIQQIKSTSSSESLESVAKTKRQTSAGDTEAEGEPNTSVEDELLTQTLHFVDKLQTDPEPCHIPGKRIIILKSHKFQPEQFFPVFAEEVKRTVQIANIINDLLLFTKSPPEDFMDVFFAMTQSLVETGPQVTGCAIAFDLVSSASSALSGTSQSSPSSSSARTQQSVSEPQSLFPYSYRTRNGEVVVTDLSKLYKPQTTTWFSVHVNRSTDGLLKHRNRIYANKTDIGNLTVLNAKWNKVVAVTPEDGYWATPYYDCLLRNWVIQYSIPFYQLEGITLAFKGVVLLEANFEAIQINQCAEDGSLFSNTHRCNRASTECKNIPSAGLRVGSYKCTCKDGYQFPNPYAANQFFNGRTVENSYLEYKRNITSNYTTDFHCLPMTTPSSSSTLLSGESEPIVVFDFMIRGISLGIQSFCMTVSVVIGTVIICLRKTKVMRSSIWALLEMLLFGAVLLYATVVVQYFEPTTTTCLLLPWFREVGFAIVYGVLVLKIYRILAEFQSRKAHRVHVRDKDLFKYLAVILIVVIAYMSAWTAVNMDHLDNNSTILERLYTHDDDLVYTLCRSMWWDYVIETGEFIFLCFGMYMCYCVRSAPTEYSEGRFITGAICYEAVMSAIFYVLRHLWWYELHPDHLFLMFFLRCQLTVTVILIIILGPKLWYAHRPTDEDQCRSRAYSQSDVQDSSSPETMKLNVGISSNGDVEVGEISLTEMDPEDIRAELKRLYTQLQIYKTKTMRKDNPHISKRRGGRKQTHRRFSLQAFHHKHRHQHDHEHEHEMSKTPEESTNSAEAMAFSIEPSVKEDPNEGKSVPSVTFKSGHK